MMRWFRYMYIIYSTWTFFNWRGRRYNVTDKVPLNAYMLTRNHFLVQYIQFWSLIAPMLIKVWYYYPLSPPSKKANAIILHWIILGYISSFRIPIHSIWPNRDPFQSLLWIQIHFDFSPRSRSTYESVDLQLGSTKSNQNYEKCLF